MNFTIGEKVVCVYPTHSLIKNEIYTICEIREAIVGVSVNVIESKPNHPYNCFWGWRFRKLDHDFANRVIEEILKQPLTI